MPKDRTISRRGRLARRITAALLGLAGLAALTATTRGGDSTNEPTIVTSDRLQVDYLSNVGTFEGNVLVVDPRITVRADKMIVTFGGGTNGTERSVREIRATGAVVITQAERKAHSAHAVYTAADGKVVLTGQPRVENQQGTVTGDRITFWRDEQRMDVEAGTRLILYPEQLKQDADKKAKDKDKGQDRGGATDAPADQGAPDAPQP